MRSHVTFPAMGAERACDPGSMVLLTRLAKQVYRRSDEKLLGMHLRLLMALSYVRDHDGAPQQELADALCMDANNVVLLLNELESAGHITRRRDPADRRRHLVELTDAGRRALLHAEHAERAIEDEVLRTLTIEERETLRNLLRRAVQDAEPSLADNEYVFFPYCFFTSTVTGRSNRGAKAFLSDASDSYHSRKPNDRNRVEIPISCSASFASATIFPIIRSSSSGNLSV